MGWRFRRSWSPFPGFRFNFSKGGVSLSIGRPGATVNIGRRGVLGTVGLPGSGISYSERLYPPPRQEPRLDPPDERREPYLPDTYLEEK